MSEITHDAAEYVPLRAACALLPGRRPGKRMNVATLCRWIMKGKLPAKKLGRSYFVRVQDVLDLLAPVTVRPPIVPPPKRHPAIPAHVIAELKGFGITV